MQIARDAVIAGYPALTIRALLRSSHQFIDTDSVVELLGVEPDAALQLLRELTVLGLLVENPQRNEFKISDDGYQLRHARATAPLKRRTADRLVDELEHRIAQVNGADALAYRVSKLLIFGSYVRGDDPVGELNVAVVLRPRRSEPHEHEALCEARIASAARHFPNFIDRLAYPETEVLRILRGRSQGMHLYDLRFNSQAIYDEPHRVLFDDGAGIA
jgi:hypothetical protein